MTSRKVREALILLGSHLEAPPGFEPGVKVLQTSALPLGYGAIALEQKRDSDAHGGIPMNRNPSVRIPNFYDLVERKTGFEPATLALARRCSTPEPLPHVSLVVNTPRTFETSIHSRLLVARDGIEPPTRGFSVLCSTD